MAELTPELADKVLAALAENAEEAAGALGRAFEGEYVLNAGEAGAVGGAIPAESGLLFAFKFGDEAMLATLPANGDLVPEWVKEPDVTGESKLNTLSQELSMLLVPDTLMADVFEASWVEDLAAAVERAQPAGDATRLPIEVARGEALSGLSLIWPVERLDAAIEKAEASSPTEETPPAAANEEPVSGGETAKGQSTVLRMPRPAPRDYRDLPPNAISALQVMVPVSVNLAGKKMALQDVIELGPGSIITFDKGCADPIEVAIGDLAVAMADAVKVGERFGVRVSQMILPEEHFRPMLPTKAS